MRVNGTIRMAEGTEIQNLTAPSGPDFPTEANDAEIFFKTEPTKSLFVYRDGQWVDLLTRGSGDAVELITATSNQNFILPSAELFTTKIYRIKRIDSAAYSVILTPQAGQLIEGNPTFSLFPSESLTMIGRGSDWYII